MAEQRLCDYSDAEMAELWSGDWRDDLRNAIAYLDACDGGLCAPVRREAERLVRKHWAAIERVASALAERGELTGDEIDGLIARATIMARTHPHSVEMSNISIRRRK
jgi:hypothetical protein